MLYFIAPADWVISWNELFVLKVVISSYNCFQKIIISYFKPYNCECTNDPEHIGLKSGEQIRVDINTPK